MTKAEALVKEALYELWFEHYTKPITLEQRLKLTQDFVDIWLDSTQIKIDKPFIYHPSLHHKNRYDQPPVTVQEVLADFILRAHMVAERDEEYPVTNPEAELNTADKRLKREVGLFSDNIDAEAGERTPYGTLTDAEAIARMYTPRAPVTVKKLTAELARVKNYAEFYATTFAEEYGYEKLDVLQRIKSLKLERIKTCVVCDGAFYPRNIRREVCDQQIGVLLGGEISAESACELAFKSNYNAEYYQEKVKKTG
ncbi:hypothetical protein ACTL32_18380 [Planococcus sp. FY231025]|uniref:hypothetical protein n=1 Tax=Planococcus sp. FY231025 TaxID=3455699 RepID=UPI003F92AE40